MTLKHLKTPPPYPPTQNEGQTASGTQRVSQDCGRREGGKEGGQGGEAQAVPRVGSPVTRARPHSLGPNGPPAVPPEARGHQAAVVGG